MPYSWDADLSLVSTDGFGRKGFWTLNSISNLWGYDATTKKLNPNADLQWVVEPAGTTGTAKLKGYIAQIKKKKGAIRSIKKGFPFTHSASYFSVAGFSAYLTKSWPDGLDEHSAHVQIFPNPTHGIFYLEMVNAESAQVNVFDVTGKSVIPNISYQGASKVKVNLSEFPKGIYICKVVISGNVFTKKIILE